MKRIDRSLALSLWMMTASAALASVDRLHLRDGSTVSGSILSQDREVYRVSVSTPRGPAGTNVAVSAVRYVEYATPASAQRWLQVDVTTRVLGARTDARVTVLTTEPFGEAIVDAVRNARERIWIMAYYVSGSSQQPIRTFYETLKEKAEAGVDVRVLAEFGTSTPMPIRNVTREFGAELEKSGIKMIYLTSARKAQHKKILLVDRDKVFLGSSNLTAAGTLSNDELNVLVEGEPFARVIERDFDFIKKGAESE
jgi:phosphatidylserine/phosphatidylglycerophosphate/cardiolipin synthase-like enzyme